MHGYNSTGRKRSGVTGYEIGADHILVQFRDRTKYLYTFSSAGKTSIELMKRLSLANKGLSTYISQNKPPYQRKFNNSKISD